MKETKINISAFHVSEASVFRSGVTFGQPPMCPSRARVALGPLPSFPGLCPDTVMLTGLPAAVLLGCGEEARWERYGYSRECTFFAGKLHFRRYGLQLVVCAGLNVAVF